MRRLERSSGMAWALLLLVFISLTQAGGCLAGQDGQRQDVTLSPATEVLRVGWGAGPDELGLSVPEEANPEGPKSFAMGAGGEVYVLDQVNRRIQLFDATGLRSGTIPLSTETYSDMDLGPSGQIVLLDPWRYAAVVFIDGSGQPTASVDLLGAGILEKGGVVGLQAQADGVWAGYEGSLVRVSDPDGRPDPRRPVVDGRLSGDGSFLLKAAKEGEITVTVTRRERDRGEVRRFSASFDIPILYVTFIDSDAEGNTFLGVNLLERGTEPPFTLDQAREEMVVFDPQGHEIRRLILPVSTSFAEVTRSFRLSPDGTVHQLVIGETGATLRRYDP